MPTSPGGVPSTSIIKPDEDPPKAVRATRVAVGLVGLAFVLLAGTGAWAWRAGKGPADAGQMGDYFGGHLAGIGNVAAFLLMYAALLYQRQELALQREELRLTRDEMRLGREEAAKAAKAQELLAGKQDELIGAQLALAEATKRKTDQESFILIKEECARFAVYLKNSRNEMLSGLTQAAGPDVPRVKREALASFQNDLTAFVENKMPAVAQGLDRMRRLAIPVVYAAGEEAQQWRQEAESIANLLSRTRDEWDDMQGRFLALTGRTSAGEDGRG